jgi:hypothetical protein
MSQVQSLAKLLLGNSSRHSSHDWAIGPGLPTTLGQALSRPRILPRKCPKIDSKDRALDWRQKKQVLYLLDVFYSLARQRLCERVVKSLRKGCVSVAIPVTLGAQYFLKLSEKWHRVVHVACLSVARAMSPKTLSLGSQQTEFFATIQRARRESLSLVLKGKKWVREYFLNFQQPLLE